MIAQLTGAVVRAILIMIVISTPSLLMATTPATAQVVTLVALAAALFTFSEYASIYPGLVEFRDAPPFNRVRLVGVFVTLFLLSLVAQNTPTSSSFSLIAHATGLVVAHAVDFPFSPITLLIGMLPAGSAEGDFTLVAVLGGLSLLVGLVTITVFAILLRLHSWPNPRVSFNVWVNLPTFDPTVGGDVVARLVRDARINIIMGCVVPFLLPIVISIAAQLLDISLINAPQVLVWTVSLWSFLPVTLFMRGMAMIQVARMIARRRRQVVRSMAEGEDGWQPA